MTETRAADLDTALAEARSLAAADALDPMAVIGLADRLGGAGRTAEVVDFYQLWLQHTHSPLAHIVRFNLAVALTQIDRFAEAEESYRKAIFEKPDFVQAWFNIGTVIERQGRAPQALAEVLRLLDAHQRMGNFLQPTLAETPSSMDNCSQSE